MAHCALRFSTISYHLSLQKNGTMPNNICRRTRPVFSHWNLIPRQTGQLVSKIRALKWEIGSSIDNENRQQESDGHSESVVTTSQAVLEEKDTGIDEMQSNPNQNETLILSIAPLPYLIIAALPGVETVRSVFGPFAELVKTWSLPDWLVHWGHPGNMAVVLFAMGGYGSYLGWQIRLSDDVEVKAKAKDLHPKLLGGMFFFFALGATGGVISLLTSNKPILESPHAVTGLIGLALLTIQTILPVLFEAIQIFAMSMGY